MKTNFDSIVKLSPIFKDYLWGGTRLRELYGKNCDYDCIAESWELSCHDAGQSKIASGSHTGMSLKDYLEIAGKEVLGSKCCNRNDFPIMIKFIDAKSNLSIQVHPDDAYAHEVEHQNGKNEMWVILDRDPGAFLYLGFNRLISKEEVRQRLADNTILEVLNKVETHPGDVFFIPAGTVHAIGEGNLICEIQQSSDCTYRLYDYDRRDKNGNPRELHVDKSLDVADLNVYSEHGYKLSKMAEGFRLESDYFVTSLHKIKEFHQFEVDDSSFMTLICLNGEGLIRNNELSMNLKKGDTIFIHADAGMIEVEGNLEMIRVTL